MGRWIVILIASFFTVGALAVFLPGLRETAFHALGAGIPWIGLVGLGVVYGFHRMSGKG
jgi:hypothetical protein